MDFKIDVQDNGLIEKWKHVPEEVKKEGWKIIRSVSFAVMKRVQLWLTMSVDTGRARASWAVWDQSQLKKPNPDANADDAVWEEKENDLSLTQGTNVFYVPDLEEGSSQRAPSGGISAATKAGEDELEKQIAAIVDKVL